MASDMPPQDHQPAASELKVDPVEMLELKPLPPDQMGTSTEKSSNYTASVSNKSGYLCHIHVEVDWDIPPNIIFQIFTHPDNSGVFKDIHNVGYRNVVADKPGWRLVEVEQVGKLKVLWITRLFSTYLSVTEDSTNPEKLVTTFSLLKSDVLGKFQGSWELTPIRDPDTQQVVGCHGVLEQDVLPKGMPTFLQRVPVLGGLLRKVSLGTIKSLVDDLNHVAKRYKSSNKSLDALLRDIANERGHQPAGTSTSSHKPAGTSTSSHKPAKQPKHGSKAPESFAVGDDSDDDASNHNGSSIGTSVKNSLEDSGEGSAAAAAAAAVAQGVGAMQVAEAPRAERQPAA